MNLYDLMNAELQRMTDEMNGWFKLSIESGMQADRYGNKEPSPNAKIAAQNYHECRKEVLAVRKRIFDSFEGYDKKIQEIIAEKALTSS